MASKSVPGASELQRLIEEEAVTRRFSHLERLHQDRLAEERLSDIAGYWRGYAEDGRGKVSWKGKIYLGEVIANTSIPVNTVVNLRRTPTGNFINW